MIFASSTDATQGNDPSPENRSFHPDRVTYNFAGKNDKIELQQGNCLLFTNQVKVNGKTLGYFLVDTGAAVSVIQKEYLDNLDLEITRRKAKLRSGYAPVVRAENLRLGPVTSHGHYLIVGKLPSDIQDMMEGRIVGILGIDVLRHVPFSLSYANKELLLHNPDTFSPPQGLSGYNIRGQLMSEGPHVKADLGSEEGWFIIDTGTNRQLTVNPHGEFQINWKNAEKVPASASRLRAKRKTGVGKMVGDTGREYKIHLTSLSVFDTPQHDLHEAGVEKAGLNNKTAGVLGGPVLQHFDITFDLNERRVWAKKAPGVSKQIKSGQIRPGKPNFTGNIPIAHAILYRSSHAVNTLVEAGSPLKWINSSGSTLLHYAVREGRRKTQIILSNTGRALINKRNDLGATPLMAAAGNGRADSILLLLEQGSEVNLRSKDSFTALGYAIIRGSTKVTKQLLKAGSAVDAKINECENLVSLAAARGQRKIFRMLLAAGATMAVNCDDGRTILHAAAAGGCERIIETVLKRHPRVGVNSRTDTGITPLMSAARAGSISGVRELLDRGADPTVGTPASKDGATALHLAAMHGYPKIVSALIGAGVNADVRDANKATPLIIAAGKGNREVVKRLIDKGANLNVGQERNLTAMHFAASQGHVKIIQTLASAGGDIEAQAVPPLRPIHLAAMNGHVRAVLVLLELGATPNSLGPIKTPAALAADNGHKGISRILRNSQK